MDTKQREEIEATCLELEEDFEQDVLCSMSWPEISTLIQFARQQLNLRVDGEKLTGLQDWYAKQCNGDWEHMQGVKIETSDNPGWSAKVDVEFTPLQHLFASGTTDGVDWEFSGGQLIAYADGADKLTTLLAVVSQCLTTTPEEKE